MNFVALKNKTFDFYNKWRSEGSYCPALDREICITLKGWNHLMGNGENKKRTIHDKARRFKLIPIAREIIEKSTTIQNIRMQEGRKYYALEAVKDIEIYGDKPQITKIRVILQEDPNGKIVFFSVMSRK